MTATPFETGDPADPRARAVFEDIRATRRTDNVGNFWRALAFDPELLEETWGAVKRVTAAESALDAKTKEMIYLAVSIANACAYCVASHTAAARARGMTPAEHAELLRVVSTAARTNHLATALQPPIDAAFAPREDASIQKTSN